MSGTVGLCHSFVSLIIIKFLVFLGTCTQCQRSLGTVAHAMPKNASSEARRWQLMSSVCLERLPIVTQEMNPIEREISALFAKMDIEYSCLSDHELRHAEDL